MDKDVTDQMDFTLYVKNVQTPYPMMLCPMRMNFTKTDVINANPDDPVNQHRYGFPPGKPTIDMQWVTGYDWETGAVSGANWYPASDYDEDEDIYTPFAYLDDGGDIVIDTASPRFQELMENYVRVFVQYGWGVLPDAFVPGAAYHWGIFGRTGGTMWDSATAPGQLSGLYVNGAYFWKGLNANSNVYLAISYGSSTNFGLEPPEGLFDLIIDPSAE
jgi:hypothetical protein